jgi:PleD family two-component response regulator
MKTFMLNSERSNVSGTGDDFSSHASLIAAQHSITDVQTLTQVAPIMLSDDEPQITRLYETLMARVGLHTVSMPQADRARDYMFYNPVSLVISELMKPRFTGLELLKELRQNPVTATIPFIMITATPDYESHQMFNTLGGNLFLSKPIDARRLTQTVTQLLSALLVKHPAI